MRREATTARVNVMDVVTFVAFVLLAMAVAFFTSPKAQAQGRATLASSGHPTCGALAAKDPCDLEICRIIY